MKINIFILMLLMFSSYNKNIAEMELLEGTWLLSDPDINHYWSVSKNVSVEFVVYDVNKANAKYFEISKV